MVMYASGNETPCASPAREAKTPSRDYADRRAWHGSTTGPAEENRGARPERWYSAKPPSFHLARKAERCLPVTPRDAGLITRRSQVRVLPPLFRKSLQVGRLWLTFFFSHRPRNRVGRAWGVSGRAGSIRSAADAEGCPSLAFPWDRARSSAYLADEVQESPGWFHR